VWNLLLLVMFCFSTFYIAMAAVNDIILKNKLYVTWRRLNCVFMHVLCAPAMKVNFVEYFRRFEQHLFCKLLDRMFGYRLCYSETSVKIS